MISLCSYAALYGIVVLYAKLRALRPKITDMILLVFRNKKTNPLINNSAAKNTSSPVFCNPKLPKNRSVNPQS